MTLARPTARFSLVPLKKSKWLKIFLSLSTVCTLGAETPEASPQPTPQPTKSLGKVLFNEDGDFTFVGENPEEWQANLRAMLTPLKDIPVQTLVYSLATGTDVLLYPSEAGSSWGWRSKEMPEKLKHMAAFPLAVQSGYDGVRWAAQDADALGLAFVPAFRMNDAHYTSGEAPYLEGKFWAENREKFTFKVPPYPIGKLEGYKELLDFSHPEVREHRLSVIREAIHRYRDTMDGFLLDFMRTPVFFPPATIQEKKGLMTDLVAAIRRELDAAETATGRQLPLLVRIPPTLKNCDTVGLDIPAWVNKKLVQVLIPSTIMTVSHDSPIEEFVKLAKPQGIQVYFSICERTAYTFAFTTKAPATEDFVGRTLNMPLLRGAAINYLSKGADGFELYNFNLPLQPGQAEGFHSLVEDTKLTRESRTYAVTPAYFYDYLDTYEPPKQVPFNLDEKTPSKTVQLYIGENPQKLGPDTYVGLRIGISQKVPVPPIRIKINGKPLPGNAVRSESLPIGKQSPTSYAQFSLPNANTLLKQGWNDIAFDLPRNHSGKITVMEIQVGVIPPSE